MSASAKPHAVEIDLPGEKVRSNPATGARSPRSRLFWGSIAASRPGLVDGAAARPTARIRPVSRAPKMPVSGSGAPERLASDRIGAHPEEVEQMLLADLRADLDSLPPSRPARPAPRNTPGGVPDAA